MSAVSFSLPQAFVAVSLCHSVATSLHHMSMAHNAQLRSCGSGSDTGISTTGIINYPEVFESLLSFAEGVYACQKTGGYISIEEKDEDKVCLFWTSHENSHYRHESDHPAVLADFRKCSVDRFYKSVIRMWPIDEADEMADKAAFLLNKLADASSAVFVYKHFSWYRKLWYRIRLFLGQNRHFLQQIPIKG